MEVIDRSDTDIKVEEPKKRQFSLKNSKDDYARLASSLTVPTKQKRWKDRLKREWTLLRQQFRDKAPGTQKLYISKFRAALKAAILDVEDDEDRAKGIIREINKEILIFEEDISEAVKQEAQKRIRTYGNNLVRITSAWEPLLREFQLLLHHKDPELVAVGLMATTGRRFAEVLSSGSFYEVSSEYRGHPVKMKYEVGFHGQLKTRGAEGTRYDETYNIPVNALSQNVIRAFHTLRHTALGREWAGMDSDALNGNVNRILNNALRSRAEIVQLWPEDEFPLSLKALRPFYAEVAYHYHAPETVTKGAYFARILGHSEDDYHSALSYMRFSLTSKDDYQNIREIERLRKLLDEQKAGLES